MQKKPTFKNHKAYQKKVLFGFLCLFQYCGERSELCLNFLRENSNETSFLEFVVTLQKGSLETKNGGG